MHRSVYIPFVPSDANCLDLSRKNLTKVKYYKVKEGQTVQSIAAYFSVSPYLLAKCNGLDSEPFAGRILQIPTERGHAYIVQEGDTKEKLCGNAENYARKNGTEVFYIGMRVVL